MSSRRRSASRRPRRGRPSAPRAPSGRRPPSAFGASAEAAAGGAAAGGAGRRRGTGRGRRSVARAVGRGHPRHVLRARDAGHVRGGRQRRAPTRRGRRCVRLRSGRAADGASPPPPPGIEIAGRSTRETTSATCARQLLQARQDVLANCQMPTPSIAAAIITPASEDFDSRMSSVCIALPPPSDISSRELVEAGLAAGARRVAAEPRTEAGSASSRSISRAATSASVGERPSPPQPLGTAASSGLPSTNTTGRKNTSHSVPMTPYTTGAGTSTSRKIVL